MVGIVKKIAFLFLVYDKINHEEIWAEFFTQDNDNRHSIYIHYKDKFESKYFNNCKLSHCVETEWGDISLVRAQNLLLLNAMKDRNNVMFIFCSGSCVPFKTFNYVYGSLNEKYSYFNMAPDSESFPRCLNALKYIDAKYVKKASQWCILNRRHAEKILGPDKDKYLEWFKDTIGDEHCYITYLYYLGIQNELILTYCASNSATTFTNWPHVKYMYSHRNPNIKNYETISAEEVLYLLGSKCLFGRKFDISCDLRLLHKLIAFKNEKKLKK